MAIESWIDSLTKLWAISDGRKGTVHSFRLFERDEFPESLPDLNTTRCAITYPTGCETQYSIGGPCIDIWRGVTEFHLSANVNKSNLPYLVLFFKRIRDAAASDIQLGGLVDYFMIDAERGGILGPMSLQYGNEAPHHGLMVYWKVKENVSGDFTVSA